MDENQVGTSIGLCGPIASSTRSRLAVVRQVGIPIEFEGERFDEGFRADMIIQGKVIVGLNLGYLLNFGEALMKDGITRIINGQL